MLFIDQYRARIGNFNNKYLNPGKTICRRLLSEYHFWCCTFLNFIFLNLVAPHLLTTYTDVETNPGPGVKPLNRLSLYCLNIRSMCCCTRKPSR